jgi:hypothetical protein
MIFTYVLTRDKYRFSGYDLEPIVSRSTYQSTDMGLLLACRQVYAETALLPYKLNTIFFRFDPRYPAWKWKHYVRQFLKKRSVQQIKAIVSLKASGYDREGPQRIVDESGVYWAKRLGV